MTPQEIEKLVKSNMQNAKPDRDRVIGSRRFDLVVWRMENGEKVVVETIEYLTRRQANDLRSAYLSEDSLRSDIIECVTTDRNGNEIIFTEKPEPTIVCGRTEFGTPAATNAIIERDRKRERSRSSFVRKANKVKAGKEIRRTNNFRDPLNPAHEIWLDGVKRNGFTIINKVMNETFLGSQSEAAEYIFDFLKSGGRKIDLDIRFNGV